MANNPKNKGMCVKRPFCPFTPTTTSTVYNLTNHFSRLQHQQPPNTKSPKYPSSDALSHKVVSQQGKRVVLESGKEGEKPQEEDGKKVVGKLVVVNGGVERRSRSFSGDSKVELSKFLMNNSAKLMAADMPPLIQIHAVGFARKIKDSLEKFTSKTLAFSLKKEFDGIYGPAWHCIVGSSFGSFVTHSSGGFLYFSLDQKLYILLFKTAVQRAD